MIEAILVINTQGKCRLQRFYTETTIKKREEIIHEVYSLVSKRSETVCNILEGSKSFGEGVKLIYRHYATLFFVFAVDNSESELGILDLIQVFVEALDKTFENVCELDLIFHCDKVHYMLEEIVMGGMVLETHLKGIIKAYSDSKRHERVTSSLHQNKATNINRK